jgi:large subunit ribosomal protein L5
MSRLKDRYQKVAKAELQQKFNYSNPMLVPRLEKIVISMGLAEAAKDKNALQSHLNELSLIAGQRAVPTKAKKAISNFKLREGQTIGAKVTLRGQRMYDFMYRFCNLVCPRISDFQGFKAKGDGLGNCSIGITDQQVFLELNLDEVKRSQGMNITFVTTAKNDEECIELLRLLGLPYKNLPICVAA